MGVSIFSGSVTTFLSGLALFGGKLVTFQKFALIICSTIFFSFATAMLFFTALMHTYGPQDEWCDLCSCCTDKETREFLAKQREEREDYERKPKSYFDLRMEGGDDCDF